MLNGFLSVWLLDCINLIKYDGIDVFDSILNISSSTWIVYWLIILCGITTFAAIKTILDNKK